MPLLEDLVTHGVAVVVVDEDPAVLTRLAGAGISTVRGDASDSRILARAGAPAARVVCSTINRTRDNEAVLSLAPPASVLVRVFDRDDADWVRERGGVPVLYSEAAAGTFMQWFERWKGSRTPDERGGGELPPPAGADIVS
jgi:Trk K+ transport system NAD-binding subunit